MAAVLLASGAPAMTARFLVVWLLVGLIATLVLWPFRRAVGGDWAKDDGPGGAEAGYVRGIWLAAAIAVGLSIVAVG